MLQNLIEAESGLYSSPDGSPPGPPSGPTTLSTAKDIITQLDVGPMLRFIQEAAYKHFLEGGEDFDPKRVSLVPIQLDEASLHMLAEHGIADNPLMIIYDQRKLDQGYPVEIQGELDGYGDINVDVKQPPGSDYDGFYITDFTICRKYIFGQGLIISTHDRETVPFGASKDMESVHMPLLELHDRPDDTHISFVTLPIDLIRQAQTIRPASPTKAATAVEPAPPLPVMLFYHLPQSQEATARPPRIEAAAARKQEQPPVVTKVPSEKPGVRIPVAITTPAYVEPARRAETTKILTWDQLTARVSSFPYLTQEEAGIPSDSRTGYILKSGTNLFISSAAADGDRDTVPGIELIINGIRQKQADRWRSKPPSGLEDMLDALSPDGPDRLRVTLRPGEKGEIVIGNATIMIRRRDKTIGQVHFKEKKILSLTDANIIVELMNLAKRQARPDIPRSRPSRSGDLLYTDIASLSGPDKHRAQHELRVELGLVKSKRTIKKGPSSKPAKKTHSRFRHHRKR